MRLIDADLISRQAAIDAMDECYWSIMGDKPPKLDEKTALYVDLKQAVKRLPSAEKKGKWKVWCHGRQENDLYVFSYSCSVCGFPGDKTDYCPNCGARMEESDGGSCD